MLCLALPSWAQDRVTQNSDQKIMMLCPLPFRSRHAVPGSPQLGQNRVTQNSDQKNRDAMGLPPWGQTCCAWLCPAGPKTGSPRTLTKNVLMLCPRPGSRHAVPHSAFARDRIRGETRSSLNGNFKPPKPTTSPCTRMSSWSIFRSTLVMKPFGLPWGWGFKPSKLAAPLYKNVVLDDFQEHPCDEALLGPIISQSLQH